ncbi:MAG: hypothetical protein AAF772_01990 [Acidobacteriota bacterium]
MSSAYWRILGRCAIDEATRSDLYARCSAVDAPEWLYVRDLESLWERLVKPAAAGGLGLPLTRRAVCELYVVLRTSQRAVDDGRMLLSEVGSPNGPLATLSAAFASQSHAALPWRSGAGSAPDLRATAGPMAGVCEAIGLCMMDGGYRRMLAAGLREPVARVPDVPPLSGLSDEATRSAGSAAPAVTAATDALATVLLDNGSIRARFDELERVIWRLPTRRDRNRPNLCADGITLGAADPQGGIDYEHERALRVSWD